MRTALLATLLLAAVLATTVDDFIAFTHEFGKKYHSKHEFDHRFGVFVQNQEIAKQLTKLNGGTAEFGITQFSDLTQDEFRAQYLNAAVGNQTHWETIQPEIKRSFPKMDYSAIGIPEADPVNFNWADHGVVTGVYNQAQCGSCWAFSATETIESYFALSGNGLHSLSMQQVVSCDHTSYGCNGGWTINAYRYVQGAGGIDAYSEYPYTSGDGVTGSCKTNLNRHEAKVTGYKQLPGENGIHAQASSGGPVSVCVDASSWQFYRGGVMSSCGQNIDHCVQLTGYANYGRSGSLWIVRNSWGTTWGERGYIRIETGKNLCAIGNMATVVTATRA